ncbi:MAG: hypothetical protein WKF75_21820, partial [Singulisphaera sp.]
CRLYSAWPRGASGARNRPPEKHHGSSHRRPNPPPHAPAEGSPNRLIFLWQQLPPPARQKALRTLSRLVGEQMRQAPRPLEVPHEHS